MKKLILFALILSIPLVAWASGTMNLDAGKKVFAVIAPTAFGVSQSTKADITLATTTFSRLRIQPSAAVTVKINGAGTAWPIAANTVQDYSIPQGVTSMVFSVTSSATATKVYYQAE